MPERLLIGSDSILVAEAYERGRAAEAARWVETTRSTDADGLDLDELDPLAHL
ncbi:hypothetical protein [Kribbella endophytica]